MKFSSIEQARKAWLSEEQKRVCKDCSERKNPAEFLPRYSGCHLGRRAKRPQRDALHRALSMWLRLVVTPARCWQGDNRPPPTAHRPPSCLTPEPLPWAPCQSPRGRPSPQLWRAGTSQTARACSRTSSAITPPLSRGSSRVSSGLLRRADAVGGRANTAA